MAWYWIVLLSLHSLGTIVMWYAVMKVRNKRKRKKCALLIAILLMIIWEPMWIWYEIETHRRKQKEKAY